MDGWLDLGGGFQLLSIDTGKPIGPRLDFFGDAMLLEKNPASGRFELFAALRTFKAWWRNGKPDPAYARWELTEAGWQRLDVGKEHLGKKGNLLSIVPVNEMPSRVDAGSRITLGQERCQRLREACEIVNTRIEEGFCAERQ